MKLDLQETDFVRIGDVEIPDKFFNRMKTGLYELDDIFSVNGGGILPGSTITIKAKPGVGKTTFCLSLMQYLYNAGYKTAYISGEEDTAQIAFNAARLTVEDVPVANKTQVSEVLRAMDDYDCIVIDSFQCLRHESLRGMALIEYLVNNLVKVAKDKDCTLIFIVQLNAKGDLKGGGALAYAVDVNIDMYRSDGRIIIDVYKNRFGATLPHLTEMNENGFIFWGQYDENLEDDQPKEVKVPVKEERKKTLVELGKEGAALTIERVQKELDIGEQTAYNLLRELVNDNKFVKIGRGAFSIWKALNADKQKFMESIKEVVDGIGK